MEVVFSLSPVVEVYVLEEDFGISDVVVVSLTVLVLIFSVAVFGKVVSVVVLTDAKGMKKYIVMYVY